jgi:hypothetical protein
MPKYPQDHSPQIPLAKAAPGIKQPCGRVFLALLVLSPGVPSVAAGLKDEGVHAASKETLAWNLGLLASPFSVGSSSSGSDTTRDQTRKDKDWFDPQLFQDSQICLDSLCEGKWETTSSSEKRFSSRRWCSGLRVGSRSNEGVQIITGVDA